MRNLVLRGVAAAVFIIGSIGGASATWTSNVFGAPEHPGAFMNGTSGSDSLLITASGGFLSQNCFAAGDPGFNSAQDFDTDVAGDQKIPDNGNSSMLINGLGGSDFLSFEDNSGLNQSILEVQNSYILPGSGTTNRPTIGYENIEQLHIFPVAFNPWVVVTSLYQTTELVMEGDQNQHYRISTPTINNLNGIYGLIYFTNGGMVDVYDANNSDNNVVTLNSNSIDRNGYNFIFFDGSQLRYWSGTGNNEYHVKSNGISDFQVNGNGGNEKFVLGSDLASIDFFGNPVKIGSNSLGHDSVIVNTTGTTSGHTYSIAETGAFSQDGNQIINASYGIENLTMNLGNFNDTVVMEGGFGPRITTLNAGPGSSDILEFPECLVSENIMGSQSLISNSFGGTVGFSGFEYLFLDCLGSIDHTIVSASPDCTILLDGGDPTPPPGDGLTVVPEGHPYTLGGGVFQVAGMMPVYYKNYESVETQFLDDNTSLPSGWSQFGTTSAIASTSVDAANTGLIAHIEPSATSARIIGWVSDAANTMHYSSVSSLNFLRAKFYMYRTGQTGTALNEIPNFRMRIANRFAVTSMLQITGHANSDPEMTTLGGDLVPSPYYYSPSVYRVDFDPVDVPELVNNAATEGFLRAFEAYEFDPQADGNIEMTECSVATYPKLNDSSTIVPVTQNGLIKSYRTNGFGGGDFGNGNIATSNSSAVTAKYFNGALETTGGQPLITVGTAGVTLQTLNVESDRFGVAAFDVFNDTYDQTSHTARARVEPGKQYRVRFHVTSTAASNLQPLLRFRARTIKFAYTASLEVGGATGASVQSNAIAAQALPGVGNQIPTFDRISPTENGGWYNVVMVTPMENEIGFQSYIKAQDPPGVDTQPANNSKSRRDIQFGFDILDTASSQLTSGMERGQYTVDRVDIEKYDEVSD